MMFGSFQFRKLLFLLSVVAAFATKDAAAQTQVTDITPGKGGMNGGTRISIFGSNFDTALDVTPTSPSKEVHFVNDHESYDCEIHVAESHEEQINCYTKKMNPGTYYLKLKQFNNYLPDSDYCEGHNRSSKCSLQIVDWRTPNVNSLDNVVTPPQQKLVVSGKLYTDRATSSVATSSNGLTASIRRAYITSGKSCNLVDPETTEAYGVQLSTSDGENYSSQGSFTCLLEGSYVGYQNISFIVSEDYGRSLPLSSSLKVSANNLLYMFQTFAGVTDISPRVGSINGGTLLKISGRHFYDNTVAPAKVWVGGVPCDVQSVADSGNEMTCTTGAKPSPYESVFTGGQGIKFEVFPNQNDVDFLDYTGEKSETVLSSTSVSDFAYESNDGQAVSRMSGIFIPSTDASHQFYINADKEIRFKFNPTGNSATDLDTRSWSNPENDQAWGNKFDLMAGQEYYFELLHLESGGTANVRLSVNVNRTSYTSDQTSQAVTERQKIQISSTVDKETQTVSFTNWAQQETYVSSEWDVSLQCNDEQSGCIGQYFELTLFKTSTGDLPYGTEASLVAVKLNGLLPLALSDETVTVESDGNSGYRITFNSDRGQMKLSGSTSDSTLLAITTTSTVTGEPLLDKFTFKVNGYVAPSLSNDASAADVASAVKTFFGPSCPSELEQHIGISYRYYDFENGLTPGGSITSDESFCGIFSVRNPYFILYESDENKYSVSQYSHVCFAYKGSISDSLRVGFSYENENGDDSQAEPTFSNVGLISSEDWNHFCFDLKSKIGTDYPTAADVSITRISVNRGDSDMFLDNVFIGSTTIEDSVRDDLLKTRVPAAVPHIKLQSVSVTKTDDSYSIQFTPFNCGNNFPLLGLAFTDDIDEQSSDHHQFNFGSNGVKQIHVQRTVTASPPVSGTFDISFEDDYAFPGVATGLAADVTAEVLKDELEALNEINDVLVTRSGNCFGYGWDIRLVAPAGKYPLMSVNAQGLSASPDPATATVTRTTQGALYMSPIYADFFRTVHDKPQVQVQIDQLLSRCESTSSCEFEWTEDATPQVTGIEPQTGVTSGSTITITGTGFSDATDQVSVKTGKTTCSVTEATATQIRCTVGNASAGNQDVSVHIDGKGYASFSDPSSSRRKRDVDLISFFQITIIGTVNSISPVSGSSEGGTTIVIIGTGFDDSTTVFIGAISCLITDHSYTYITCHTLNGGAALGNADVMVTSNDVEMIASTTFEFLSPVAVIDFISLTTLSVTGGEEVIITGNDFGDDEGLVEFGSHSVTVISWSATTIVVTAPSAEPGVYFLNVLVYTPGLTGYAISAGIQVTYAFSITETDIQSGSLAGGRQIKLTGTGLGNLENSISIKFCDITCDVVESAANSDSQITCETQTTAKTISVRNTESHPSFGIGYKWDPNLLEITVGDVVEFNWSFPQFVTTAIGLQTSSNSSSTTYDEKGFQLPKSTSGSYSATFNTAGTFYINSGCLNSDCSLIMRAIVKVSDAVDKPCELSVAAGDVTATIVPESISFTYRVEDTPVLTSIDPDQGDTTTNITLTGTGFRENPEVKIGGKTCTVSSSNDTHVICRVGAAKKLAVNVYHDVSVKFAVGYARVAINDVKKRHFVLLPRVDSISPASGSIEGGTLLTVQGSGFNAGSKVTVGASTTLCQNPIEVTYTSITCVTPPAWASTQEIKAVLLDNTVVACEEGNQLCQFSYSVDNTPEVTSMSFVFGQNEETFEITLAGEKFGSDGNDITVTLADTGDADLTGCSVSSASDTEVVCSINSRFAVGPKRVQMSINGKGNADFTAPNSDQIDNPAKLYSVNPSQGSINGGTKITVEGNGFIEGSTVVTINNKECNIESVTFSSLTCTTPANTAGTYNLQVESNSQVYIADEVSFEYNAASTPEVQSLSPTKSTSGGTLTITGTGFGNDIDAVAVIVGGVACDAVAVTDAQITCILEEREGGLADLQVSVSPFGLATISTSISFSYTLEVTDVSPSSGSYGGEQKITLLGNGFSENTVVTVCEMPCTITELESATTIKCHTPSNINIEDSPTLCEIEIANGENIAAYSGNYVYQRELTPIISSVLPNSGGTGGGTAITITGTGFSQLADDMTVTIDGSICDILSSTTTAIECTTNGHQGSIRTKVDVAVGSNGIATQDKADFFYIDKWSSPWTWGGLSPPVEGDFVVIQQGQTVLLDASTPILKMILIEGGELIFHEADIELNAENILITNGGLLQVGTEENPFQHKAIITMHGHLRSPELPIYGAKTLGVRNGTLDLHGKPVAQTWTLLAETASQGSTQIHVQHPLNDWPVGSEVVIATTGMRHSQRESEKRTITAVSEDGYTLTLNESLSHEHLGVTETLGGQDVEFRAEVGLLTRNIVFRGSNDQQWHDKIEACPTGFDTAEFATQTCFQGRFGEEIGSDQFGGCIMMHSATPDSPYIMARIENVELNYVGQAFRLGRYPIHWHLMGNVSGMYVRNNAIHQTFNRAVTIHGTHNLLVEGNVVYDVMGGAIFIEDGIETENIIQYNLAVFVRQSTSLLNDDITPAAYWVTNPNNILRHNHAAGGTHFGFWYRMHEHPDGPSFTTSVCPRKVELGEFSNNTVHSQGWFGIWIFQTYTPMEGGSCSSNVPNAARFYSLTAWRCEKGAEWVNGGAIQFHDFVLADNEQSGMDLKLVVGTSWGLGDRSASVVKSIIVGHSSLVASDYESNLAIVLPLAPGFTVSNVKLINFNRTGVGFGLNTVQGLCTFLCGGFSVRFKQMSFESVTKKVKWRWQHEAVLVDLDGTLIGSPRGKSIVPYSGLMDTSLCEIQVGDLYSSTSTPSAICEPEVKFHRVALNQALPESLEGNDLIFVNQHGNTSIGFEKKRMTHRPGWMGLLPDGKTYRMYWKDGEQFTNISYNARFYDFQPGQSIVLEHHLLQKPDVVSINNLPRIAVENSTALSTSSKNLDWHYDIFTQLLQIRISNDDLPSSSRRKRASTEINDEDFRDVDVRPNVYRCFYHNCIGPVDPDEIPPTTKVPTDFQLWSNTSSLCIVRNETTGTFIVQRSAPGIKICWVVVDVNEITVTNLTIFGVLHFNKHSVNVSATYINVLGGRIYTRTEGLSYYNKQLVFELHGNHSTEGWIMPGIELSSKALGCFGGCDFHGIPHDVYWTRLAATADAGSKKIALQNEVDWKAGDEIVITTTGYRAIETEKAVISSKGADNKTLTLTSKLLYRHLAENYKVGEKQFDMRAEVGLLTRNIKIKGASYDGIESELFGARVLIGNTPVGSEALIGWGRFTDVEFHQTGQEGWTEPWDPRFSLAWVNTGAPSAARPSSYVHGCSFHDGYSTAIGVFGSDKINITNNVVHRTIHDGIRISGAGHRIERNLVTVTLFRGSYGDRFETGNFMDWQASFELSEANRGYTLIGNVAAGSERVGFHIDGESCSSIDESGFSDNVVHGTLHGIFIFTDDGIPECSLVRNFLIYKAWDYGIYFQTQYSVHVKDTIIADATVGIMPMIFGPPGLSHQCVEKETKVEGVLCVGRSEHFDSTLDFMDEQNDKNLIIQAAKRKAPRTPNGGSTCIMLPTYQSSPNGAPFKPFHLNKNYPTVCGVLNISGLHAHNYKPPNLVFYNNPDNEDAIHPTLLRKITLTEVDNVSKVRYDRPSLGKINPSDCVDMECDAKKKVIIKDLDGSFLGAIGTVLPDAAFEWDGDPKRGLGDYRIPKTMLTSTSPNGTRIAPPSNKGIIGNKNCSDINAWQAFDCHGEGTLNYEMLIIQSLDDDTETRRLSPVALRGDDYIDLNNGPQDHGWCSGYTCQKRISTFYTIVATDKHFDLFFTGYAPRTLNLRLLNVDDTKAVRLAIWYARPERLDVYSGNIYIHPENSIYDEDQDEWVWHPASESNMASYLPAVNSTLHGANYMDLQTRLLYVTLRGKEPVTIKTVPAIIVKIGFPAVSIDDFFGENLRRNLIDFLRVDPSKIKIVNIVREGTAASRKKRDTSTETITYTLMYSNTLDETSYEPAEQATVIEVLNNDVEALIIAHQNETLSEILGINPTVFQTAPISVNLDGEAAEDYFVLYNIPRTLSVTSFPSSVEEYLDFSQQPTLSMLDENGEVVATLNNTFEVTVTMDKSGENADPQAELIGDTTVMFTNGVAEFTNLNITHSGTYSLEFQITNPAGVSLSTSVNSVIVTRRTVDAIFVNNVPSDLAHNAEIEVVVELQNANGQPLPAIGYKGHTWKADVSLDNAASHEPTSISSGTTTFEFDTHTSRITTTGLTLANTGNFHRYNLRFRIYTEPADYEFIRVTNSIQFNDGQHPSMPSQQLVTFALSGMPYIRILRNSGSFDITSFETKLHNDFIDQLNTNFQRLHNFGVTDNNGNTDVTFTMSGVNDTFVTSGIKTLEEYIRNGSALYNGNPLAFVTDGCAVSFGDECQDQTSVVDVNPVASVAEQTETWVFVVVGVVLAVVLGAGLIACSCFMKRAKNNKVRQNPKGCLDAESSRGTTPILDSLYTGSTTPVIDSQTNNYTDLHHRSSQ